jgi:hypothetical protein
MRDVVDVLKLMCTCKRLVARVFAYALLCCSAALTLCVIVLKVAPLSAPLAPCPPPLSPLVPPAVLLPA